MGFKNQGGGVYIIINKVNNKAYIGSTNHFKKRHYEHVYFLTRNLHPNKKLQNSWNKYGEDKFEFKVVEECVDSMCTEREQYYLDKYKPLLNISPNANSQEGYYHTKESKIKMSDRWTSDRKERIAVINYNTKRKEVLKMTLSGEVIEEFKSIKEAGESLGLRPTQYHLIGAVCKGKDGRKKCYGYSWKYKN